MFLTFERFDFINKFDVDTVGETIGSKIPILVYINKNENREHFSILEKIYHKNKYNFIITHNKLKDEFE